MCVLGWWSQQTVSSEETHNGAETCLPDDFISFSWHPYWHTCQLSRFRRETPDFEDFSRFRGFLPITPSQQKISGYHDLAQDFFEFKNESVF